MIRPSTNESYMVLYYNSNEKYLDLRSKNDTSTVN